MVETEAASVIDAPWPDAADAGRGVFADEAPRVHVEPLDRSQASKSEPTPLRFPPLEPGPAVRPEGPHLPRSGDARRRRRAARRPARLRLRPGRRRKLRQRVPAAAPAARAVRRPDPQLTAGRGRHPRRLRRRGARRAAADRRDPVQRLRRDRLQPARQQRGQDPLPLGRLGADGRAHAVGRTAPRRAVPQPEHRALVLPHAGPEDRRARRRRTTRGR